MNNTAKKQNRILLIALVIVLTLAAVLIALTGGANRKNKEENPPLDTKVTESDSAEDGKNDALNKAKKSGTSDAMTKKDDAESPAPAKSDKKADETSDEAEKTGASADDTADVAAMQSGVLPTFSAPVDAPVLKDYSDEIPVFSYTMNDYRTHGGLDFACSPGTPVKSAADGTVCEVIDDPMMGVSVAVSHSGGAVTRYKGLSEESMNLVKAGDTVKRGQVIGASGSTALIESAEEDHLHFELEVNGASENPGEFMKVSYLSDMIED